MRLLRRMLVLASLLVFVTGANAKPDQGNQGQNGQDQGEGQEKRGQNDRKSRPQHQAPPAQAQQQRPPQNRGQQRRHQPERPRPQQRPQYTPRDDRRVDRQPVRVDDRSYRAPGRVERQPVGRVVDRSRVVTPVAPRTTTSRVESRSSFWPRFRATNWSTQHRTWVQRGGYRGYRIPTSRYNLYFGRRHHFRLSSFTVRLYDDEPAFYSYGYWVVLLDPVPEYWDPDWYDVDYVRIVQLEDGYYLLNESDPDVLLAVDIRLG